MSKFRPILLQLACTASHWREACVIKSPSKAPVITQEIDSEIEKVCGHGDIPIPHLLHTKIPVVWQQHCSCADKSAVQDAWLNL